MLSCQDGDTFGASGGEGAEPAFGIRHEEVKERREVA